MIYINYKRERLWIAPDGKTYPELSITGPNAVLTDVSTFKKINDENYRYYSKTHKGYFLENEIVNDDSRSLLEVLGLQEGIIVGLYFSNRILIFTLVNGEIKSRFSPENIFSPEEIVYPYEEWGIPENTPVKIYGINLPFEELFTKIEQTKPLKDREEIRKKYKFIQNAVSIALIVFTLLGWAGVEALFSYKDSQYKKATTKINNAKQELAKEVQARLPIYLECMNVPLDKVFQEISFMENFSYSSTNISVDNEQIRVKADVNGVEAAYMLKEEAIKRGVNFELNLPQGGNNVQTIITKNFKPQKDFFFPDSNKFCNSINYYNQLYNTKVK